MMRLFNALCRASEILGGAYGEREIILMDWKRDGNRESESGVSRLDEGVDYFKTGVVKIIGIPCHQSQLVV